jgi:probable phosphoglycerate mutase
VDIFLVRHGEAAATWGQSADPGLSDLGREQAEQAARELVAAEAGTLQILSSPLARARETAEPLLQVLPTDCQIDKRFREIPAPVPLVQRQAWLQNFMAQTWGEQEQELHAWRDQAVTALLEQQRPCAVFTHFLVINAVVGFVEQRDETLCFWPDNGSITHLRLVNGRLQLIALGRELQSLVN